MSAASMEKEAARCSLTLADSVAYYVHRRYQELRTAEALEDYLRASAEAMRRLVAAE